MFRANSVKLKLVHELARDGSRNPVDSRIEPARFGALHWPGTATYGHLLEQTHTHPNNNNNNNNIYDTDNNHNHEHDNNNNDRDDIRNDKNNDNNTETGWSKLEQPQAPDSSWIGVRANY